MLSIAKRYSSDMAKTLTAYWLFLKPYEIKINENARKSGFALRGSLIILHQTYLIISKKHASID